MQEEQEQDAPEASALRLVLHIQTNTSDGKNPDSLEFENPDVWCLKSEL